MYGHGLCPDDEMGSAHLHHCTPTMAAKTEVEARTKVKCNRPLGAETSQGTHIPKDEMPQTP